MHCTYLQADRLRKIEEERAEKLRRSSEKSRRGRSMAERAEAMHHTVSDYIPDK